MLKNVVAAKNAKDAKSAMYFSCVRVICVFIPGLLPFTLRAALCAFKNFPEIFVADH
jgi:hypothetical protein